jgi:hypothetical protein
MTEQPPPPPPPGGNYGQPAYGGPAPQSNSKATWALVLGILSIVCCGIFAGIPAIILGRKAQAEGAGGTARAGEILGYVSIALTLLSILLYAIGVFSFEGTFDTTP